MTPKELMSRIKTLMQGLVWTGTTYIFGENNVHIAPEFPMNIVGEIIAPSCYIVDMGQTNHPEHEGIIDQKIHILLFIENVGDNKGEAGVIGGNRTANTSSGAGVYDIEKEVITAIRDATSLSSAKVVMEGAGRAKLNKVKGNDPLVIRVLKFSARTYIY